MDDFSLTAKPMISVIIPIHNSEKTLRRTLQSVLAQTMLHFEVICVNDGSTDSSASIVAEMAEDDVRVTLVSQAQSGAGIARNTGLELAQGRYVMFLDSDDLFDEALLSRMYNACERSGADICVCEFDRVCEGGRLLVPAFRFPGDIEEGPVSTMEIMDRLFQLFSNEPWNKLFRREFVLRYGLQFQGYPRCNDAYFSRVAIALADTVFILKEPLIQYTRGGEGSLSSRMGQYAEFSLFAAESIYDKLGTAGVLSEAGMQSMRRFCVDRFVLSFRNAINDEEKAALIYQSFTSFASDWAPHSARELFGGAGARESFHYYCWRKSSFESYRNAFLQIEEGSKGSMLNRLIRKFIFVKAALT